jgi:hypothetical protein
MGFFRACAAADELFGAGVDVELELAGCFV